MIVDGLPQFCQPQSLLRIAPCVDGVGPFRSIDLYGILLSCGRVWKSMVEYGGVWWSMVEYGGVWWIWQSMVEYGRVR